VPSDDNLRPRTRAALRQSTAVRVAFDSEVRGVLSRPAAEALLALWAEGPSAEQPLAHRLKRHRATIARALQELDRRALVRGVAPSDVSSRPVGRPETVRELTDAGERAAEALAQRVTQGLDDPAVPPLN
jgi:predicted transcriptional regulator